VFPHSSIKHSAVIFKGHALQENGLLQPCPSIHFLPLKLWDPHTHIHIKRQCQVAEEMNSQLHCRVKLIFRNYHLIRHFEVLLFMYNKHWLQWVPRRTLVAVELQGLKRCWWWQSECPYIYNWNLLCLIYLPARKS